MVEHVIRNDGVTCSSHVSGTISPEKVKTFQSNRCIAVFSIHLSAHLSSVGMTLPLHIRSGNFRSFKHGGNR
ncbi:hypothetical protein AGR1A_Cc20135 [Agrobacterium fabacearum CFBP 5771]|nr:hypothetical protein AGR1A_Cc20135 [Agrobacterium fabacearum CFBP 5771]